MQKATGFNSIAIAYIKENANRIHFWHMSKDDAINIMNGSILLDKRGILEFFYYKFDFVIYIYIYIYI